MSDLSEAASSKDDIYCGMHTDVLKEMLRYSVFSDEAMDLKVMQRILIELLEREPEDGLKTPEEAWSVFQSEYSGKKSAFLQCASDESIQAVSHLADAEKQMCPAVLSIEP